MIDIVEYGLRIGVFSPRLRLRNIRRVRDDSLKNCSFTMLFILVCCSMVFCYMLVEQVNKSWEAVISRNIPMKICTRQILSYKIENYSWGVGNFWAKYLNGNRQAQFKGIKCLHFNIRSLKNKISEVKNIIKKESPTIFGLSECELQKQYISVDQLKIQGYTTLFPKSWNIHGFCKGDRICEGNI